MIEDYTESLMKCSCPDEVWALMNDKIYPSSNRSLFAEEHLAIRKNIVRFQDVTPPPGVMGLAYRTVLYLILDGEMGNAPKNGGCLNKAYMLERTIRQINDIQKILIPADINSDIIDTYIREERKKGTTERSIHKKVYSLFQWKEYEYMLPHFLRLRYDLFELSTEWENLVEASSNELRDYLNGIGGSKEPYPLEQFSSIVTEAIEYMEIYADDCIFAANMYNEACEQNLPSTSTGHYMSKSFRIAKYNFVEPQLEKTQEYALSLKNHGWVANSKVAAPIKSCLDSIHRLQAACIIIILMLTAMRKGELETMLRYPETKKTLHHELDGSFELERQIYKTAETEEGESHDIAVPLIVVRAFYLLSYISEISDGKKEGIINLMSINYTTESNSDYRINYLINAFCDYIDVLPPTPHQFRHAMAFLISFLNDDIGIELAMTLLGHKSMEMTKKYMGHYKQIILNTFDVMFNENEQMGEALAEFQKEQSSSGLEKIIQTIEKEEPMVGPIAKRLLQGFDFAGSVTDEGKVFFAKSQRLLLERGMLAVVEHPTHFCVRDLTDSSQMPCQIGLNYEDFINAPVISAQCQISCGCRLYTEPQVEYIKELALEMEDAYPDDLVDLLKGNRYYMANSAEQHYANVIDDLESIKQENEKNKYKDMDV